MALSSHTRRVLYLYLEGRRAEAEALMVALSAADFARVREDFQAILIARLAEEADKGKLGGPEDGA